MSFVVSFYLYGFGVGFDIVKNLKLNVVYFWIDYDKYIKEIFNYGGIGIVGKDVFICINKVFGIGFDYKF